MGAPIKKYVVGGIQAAIWENSSSEGRSYHTVSLDRRYKNKNDEWKSTNSFRASDIPKAIMALQKAYEELMLKTPEAKEAILAQEIG